MPENRKRPNILLIMADQLPARTLGTYGHPVVDSPHIDALAARGSRFDAAYTNCPICAPSRASMCTGRYVSNIGTYDNGAEFPAEIPTLAHHLRRAGYQTLLSGKMHFIGPDQHHGFERRLTSDIYPSSFVWTPDWNRGAYPNEGTSVLQLEDAGRCKWDLQLDYDEEVRFRSLEAIRQLARTDDGDADPFFMCASFTHPHDPFIVPDKWWDRYEHDEIDMPAAPPVPLNEMHPYDRWLQIHHMIDVRAPSDEEIRNARHAFYGMVSYFDDIVGELVAELERVGLADDTIIAITSDHGEMLGEHGMWFKRTYRDPSTRVPLIVAGPGVARGEVASTVSLVDLLPTFLDLADAPDTGDDIDGDSLVGLLHGDDSGWKDYAVSEYYSEGVCQPMRVAVRAQVKYVYVHDEHEQLFDLAADPNELHNIIDDPHYAERLSELRAIVHTDWNPVAQREDVIRSQQRRRVINEALAAGREVRWDVEPDFDATDQYVRREDAQVTNRRWRL